MTAERLKLALPGGLGALSDTMRARLTEIGPDRLVGMMPVEGNTQPYGLLHGGASVVLAESLGSIGSCLWAYPERIAVGVDVSATHHRPVMSGHVTAIATPLYLGSSMTSWEIAVHDEGGRRSCTARLTCALVAARRHPEGA